MALDSDCRNPSEHHSSKVIDFPENYGILEGCFDLSYHLLSRFELSNPSVSEQTLSKIFYSYYFDQFQINNLLLSGMICIEIYSLRFRSISNRRSRDN